MGAGPVPELCSGFGGNKYRLVLSLVLQGPEEESKAQVRSCPLVYIQPGPSISPNTQNQ